MTPLVPLAMFGCPVLCLLVFALVPNKRTAMLLCLTAAWLLLPQYGYMWPGPLKWTKVNAVSMSVLLAVAVVDGNRLLRFRPRWFDVPAIVLCVWPAVSAFANGLGVPDASNSTVNSILMYGVPYLLGRMYITDAESLTELARVIVLGGLFYVPLCLYELRMSPMLHVRIYGFFQHQWAQMVRDGGYRPIVFMQHGLAVAMWMSACAVVVYGLWRGAGVRRLWRVPMVVWVAVLAVTALECKSAGAIGLAIVGCGAIELGRRVPPRWILCALLLVPPAYTVARASEALSAERMSSLLEQFFPRDRVSSAEDRLHQEDVLSKQALLSPVVGWGPWGGFLRNGEDQGLVGHVDSMWVITLGKYGVVGLAAAMLVYLLPVLLLARRGLASLRVPPYAPVLYALALVPTLAMIDNLSNFMPNPLFVVAAGAVATMAARLKAVTESPGVQGRVTERDGRASGLVASSPGGSG